MSGPIKKALDRLQPKGNPIDFDHQGGVSTPVEFVEFVEKAREAFRDGRRSIANTCVADQPTIFPAGSILEDWMEYARTQVESADIFLIGSVIPVCAATLGRRVRFQWGYKLKFPNVFNMLGGKPGDRKSSAILMAQEMAQRLLPGNAFLPASFSPESMYDEFAEEEGGRPDKLWIIDDANGTLTDWKKSVNGERVATRFLGLYDCTSLSENFRRNKKGDECGSARRMIPETSTSLLFGATFNVAAFQGQEVRAGMARRFLYYLAERHGRLIVRPSARSKSDFEALVKKFQPLTELAGELDFDDNASGIWADFQQQNREEMDTIDPLREAELARLSSAPMQTLSIAMIFEACCQAKKKGEWNRRITGDTLLCAINHVAACVSAAGRLDAIANQAEIAQDTEVFLAKVRHEFAAVGAFHFATRSDLTKRFCANSSRTGSWKPDDLYLRVIPLLERRGLARLVNKTGKREIYAFLAEEE